MDEEEFPSMAELFWVVAFPYTTLVSDIRHLPGSALIGKYLFSLDT